MDTRESSSKPRDGSNLEVPSGNRQLKSASGLEHETVHTYVSILDKLFT
jgi:hypothetical protein